MEGGFDHYLKLANKPPTIQAMLMYKIGNGTETKHSLFALWCSSTVVKLCAVVPAVFISILIFAGSFRETEAAVDH